ncbi:MAG: amidase, partial [Actinobacteria bacterium]|nr:amidase [Actinomycetota bacterium]
GNEIAAAARNPHDRARTAGGSSGGTAAAIAAGLIPGAIASDAGGSIRIPAAACGLIGLKPGRGVVPADRPLPPADPAHDEWGAPRMGVSGPIARNALDAALLYDALTRPARPGGADTPSGDAGEPALAAIRNTLEDPASLRGLRIGISTASPFAGWAEIAFDAAALSALDAAAGLAGAAGHAIEDAAITYDPRYPEAFTTVWTAGLGRMEFAADGDGRSLEGRLGALASMFRRRARETSHGALLEATDALRSFADSAARQWGAYDIVLTPALAFTAPLVGAFRELDPEGDYRLQCEWAPQTSMVNVAGLPAITVPIGTDAHGLPRGVQLIGRAGSELLLLQLAAQLTRA